MDRYLNYVYIPFNKEKSVDIPFNKEKSVNIPFNLEKSVNEKPVWEFSWELEIHNL